MQQAILMRYGVWAEHVWTDERAREYMRQNVQELNIKPNVNYYAMNNTLPTTTIPNTTMPTTIINYENGPEYGVHEPRPITTEAYDKHTWGNNQDNNRYHGKYDAYGKYGVPAPAPGPVHVQPERVVRSQIKSRPRDEYYGGTGYDKSKNSDKYGYVYGGNKGYDKYDAKYENKYVYYDKAWQQQRSNIKSYNSESKARVNYRYDGGNKVNYQWHKDYDSKASKSVRYGYDRKRDTYDHGDVDGMNKRRYGQYRNESNNRAGTVAGTVTGAGYRNGRNNRAGTRYRNERNERDYNYVTENNRYDYGQTNNYTNSKNARTLDSPSKSRSGYDKYGYSTRADKAYDKYIDEYDYGVKGGYNYKGDQYNYAKNYDRKDNYYKANSYDKRYNYKRDRYDNNEIGYNYR